MDLTKDESTIVEAVKALRTCVGEKSKNKQTLRNIFDEEDSDSRTPVFIVVSLFKIPEASKNGVATPYRMKIPIPHTFVDEHTDVLLITKDKSGHKGLRKDHEPSIHMYKDILRSHNALDILTEVMPLKQLRTEFRDFEAKRALFSRFDMVLSDKNIINRLPLFLGKEFYKRKKIPIAVDLRKENIREYLLHVLSNVFMYMNLRGSCSMAQVGRLNQTDDDLGKNIHACLKHFEDKIPGQWKNIRSIHIKTRNSNSVPLYVTLKSPNEVPTCIHPRTKRSLEPVIDVVDTIYGEKTVQVFPDGRMFIEGIDELDENGEPTLYLKPKKSKSDQNNTTEKGVKNNKLVQSGKNKRKSLENVSEDVESLVNKKKSKEHTDISEERDEEHIPLVLKRRPKKKTVVTTDDVEDVKMMPEESVSSGKENKNMPSTDLNKQKKLKGKKVSKLDTEDKPVIGKTKKLKVSEKRINENKKMSVGKKMSKTNEEEIQLKKTKKPLNVVEKTKATRVKKASPAISKKDSLNLRNKDEGSVNKKKSKKDVDEENLVKNVKNNLKKGKPSLNQRNEIEGKSKINKKKSKKEIVENEKENVVKSVKKKSKKVDLTKRSVMSTVNDRLPKSKKIK